MPMRSIEALGCDMKNVSLLRQLVSTCALLTLLLLLTVGSLKAAGEISPWAIWNNSTPEEIADYRAWSAYKSTPFERGQDILEYSGSCLWTYAIDLVVIDSIMYVLNINGLQVFDIANVSSPVLLKNIPLGNSPTYNDIAASGNYLYVSRYDRVYVFNISDHVNPQQVSEFVLSGTVMEIQAIGDRIYFGIAVTSGDTTGDYPAFYICDASSPDQPTILGKYEPEALHHDCRRFVVVGERVYAINYFDSRLDVISITDAARPQAVNSVDITAPADIAYDSGYLYVCGQDNNLTVFDVASPDTPQVHGTYHSYQPQTIEIRDGYLYAAQTGGNEPNGVKIFQITSPGTLDSGYLCGMYAERMVFHDNYLSIPLHASGFLTYALHEPFPYCPVKIAQYNYDTYTMRGVDVKGNYAYVSNKGTGIPSASRNGVYVVDLTDKQNPTLVNWVNTGGYPSDVYVGDSILFTSRCWATYAYSLRFPGSPASPIKWSGFGGQTSWNYYRDTLVYVCDNGGFDIFNFARPCCPTRISRLDLFEGIYYWFLGPAALMYGNIAFVAKLGYFDSLPGFGMAAVDVTDPLQAIVISQQMVSEETYDGAVDYEMAKRGDYLYLAGGTTGLSVLNVSNPASMEVVFNYAVAGDEFRGIAILRNFLFLSGGSYVHVFDLTNPISPQFVQRVPISRKGRVMTVQDDYLYVTCEEGFYIFHVTIPPGICGDADGSGSIDISDAVYLILYIFAGAPAPNPLLDGDANCDQAVDVSDAVYLIAYIFTGGPAPCALCT